MASYTTTLAASYISPLNDVERISGWNKKFVIPYSVIANAAATATNDVMTVTLGATPAVWAVNAARAYVSTAFTSTATQTLAMTVGPSGTTNAFITSTSVLTQAMIPQASALPVLTNATGTSSASLVAVFTNGTAGSLSACTAGSVTILLNIENGASGTYLP